VLDAVLSSQLPENVAYLGTNLASVAVWARNFFKAMEIFFC
jgi:hypothetical protein